MKALQAFHTGRLEYWYTGSRDVVINDGEITFFLAKANDDGEAWLFYPRLNEVIKSYYAWPHTKYIDLSGNAVEWEDL